MGQVIGVTIGIVLLMVLFSFFVYFSGWIGLVASAAVLVGGSLVVAWASGSKIALQIVSSRAWLLPIAGSALTLALSPLFFEGSFCSAQSASGTASGLFNLPGETPGKIYSSSLEGQCLANGGFSWAMQQPTGIVRAVVGLGGIVFLLMAFSGKRQPPAAPSKPVQKVSQLGDWPPDLEARLRVPAAVPSASGDFVVASFTPEMEALLREAATLNGGFLDAGLLQRLAQEPAFNCVTLRGMAAKARAIGIEYSSSASR